MKRIIKVILAMFSCLLMSGILALIACSCKKSSAQSSDSSAETPVQNGVVNGFDTIKDLYNIKFNVGTDYLADYSGTINTDSAYIKSGTGSLKIEYKSGGHPEPLFYCEKIEGLDLKQLKQVTVDVYNACGHDVKVNFNMHRKNGTIKKYAMYTEEKLLPAGEWSTLTLTINNVVMQYASDEVFGFGIEFEVRKPTQETDAQGPFIFYLDNFAIEHGAEMREEDKQYKSQIDNVIAKIEALPSGITANDESKLFEIYTLYNQLPDVYKAAVNNYTSYTNAVDKLLTELYKTEKTTESSPVLFTDRFFGVNHFTTATTYAQTAKIGFTSEEKYEDESGSTYFEFFGNGSGWAAWNFTTSAMLSEYDYLRFAIKNDTDKSLAIFYTWSNYTELKPGEWTEVEYPISAIKKNFNELEITGIGQTNPTGKVYFSAINCYKLDIDGLITPAVDKTEPYSIDGVQSEVSYNDGKMTTEVKAAGDMTVVPNKTTNSLNIAVNAYLNIYVNRYFTLEALDRAGNTVYQIPLATGWNNLSMITSNQASYNLNHIAYFQIKDMKAGDKVVFGHFMLSRNTDDAVARLYMQNKTQPAVSDMSYADLSAFVSYLSAYEDLNANQQAKLIAEINGFETEKLAKTAKAETLFLALIDEVFETFDYNKANVVNSTYTLYKDLTCVTPLSTQYLSKVEAILQEWRKAPLTFYDMSQDGFDAFSVSVRSGDTNKQAFSQMHLDDESYNVLSRTTDAVYGTVVELQNPVYSGMMVRFDYHAPIQAVANAETTLAGFDQIVFNVYNPLDTTYKVTLRVMTADWGVKYADKVLDYGWNMIVIEKTTFLTAINAHSYIFLHAEKGSVSDDGNSRFFLNETNETIRFSNFYAYTQEGYEAYQNTMVNEIISKIEGLPNISSLRYQTAELNEIITEIEAAYVLYGNKITNYATYTEFVAAYNQLPALVWDASNASDLAMFSLESRNTATDDKYSQYVGGTISTSTDATYGTVMDINSLAWSVHFAKIDMMEGYHTINNDGVNDISAGVLEWTKRLNGYDKVVFYVYNPADIDLELRFEEAAGFTSVVVSGRTLAAKQWTKIVYEKADFLRYINFSSSTYLAIKNVGNWENKSENLKGLSIKFTSFYGYTAERYDQAFPND